MKKPEAQFWEKEKDKKVRCLLCPRKCVINVAEAGFCMGRINIDGKLIASNYGEVVSIANDPIEKKPLYHFFPGSYIISTATYGCNLGCLHCQNWEISQRKVGSRYISPEEMVNIALKYDSLGICFTYSEPFIWYEYVKDTAEIAKQNDLKVVLVTNGQVNQAPLEDIVNLIDAMNIDLKATEQEFYRKICRGGDIETTIRTIELSVKNNVHVEVTYLVITSINDKTEHFKRFTRIIESIDPEIPVHFTRFFPNNQLLDLPPTPVETLIEAYNTAKERLKYVYIGNVMDERLNSTLCPSCQNLVIIRNGFYTVKNNLQNGKCPFCNTTIRGRF